MADGKVVIDTQVNTKDLKKGIDSVKTSVDSFSVGAIAKFNLWGKAIDTAVNSLTDLIPATLAAMDRVDKLSQKIGISTTAFQEWDYTLSQSGIEIEGLQMGMKTLNDLLVSASKGTKTAQESFSKLGLSWQSLMKMNADERLNAVIAALQNMKDPVQRSSLAVDLLGRSATELAPILNTSAKETQALKDRAHELGLVLDESVIKAGVEAGDAFDDLKKSMGAFKTQILIPFIPLLTSLFLGITKLLSPVAKLFSMFKGADFKTVDGLKTQLAAVNAQIDKVKNNTQQKSLMDMIFGDSKEDQLKKLDAQKKSLTDQITALQNAKKATDELSTSTQKESSFMDFWNSKLVENTQALTDSFAAMGEALATGENPLKAWASSVTSTLSDIINAYANTMIAEGITTKDYGKVASAATLKVLAGTVKGLAGKFENGGIVGGNSPTGDKLLARVNSGELILNKAQQANVASQLNAANVQTSVNVQNYAGADVSVAQNGANIDILIEKKVLGMFGTKKLDNVMAARYGQTIKGVRRG